jgi:hypothetical protein
MDTRTRFISLFLSIGLSCCGDGGEPPPASVPVPVSVESRLMYAPHLDPQSQPPALRPLPGHLPLSAEDTGLYNVIKPRAAVEQPAIVPRSAPDPDLAQRQRRYLSAWRDQQVELRLASEDEREQARARLKATLIFGMGDGADAGK